MPNDVEIADVDGDGDVDLVTASQHDNRIAWHENTDGLGTFGRPQVISSVAMKAKSVFVADVDSDGDPDVLSASERDNKLAWYENLNGRGEFGPEQIISTRTTSAASVIGADVDGDGDVDVVSRMDRAKLRGTKILMVVERLARDESSATRLTGLKSFRPVILTPMETWMSSSCPLVTGESPGWRIWTDEARLVTSG